MMVVLLIAALAQSSPKLWQDVTAGLSVAELRAAYPAVAGKVKYHDKSTEIEGYEPLPGCKSEVNIHHEAGSVDRIVIKGAGALGGKCAAKVFDALVAKYGMPASNEENEAGMFTGGLFAKDAKTSVWSRDGVSLRFRRIRNGGLAGSSWDMTYRAANAGFGL